MIEIARARKFKKDWKRLKTSGNFDENLFYRVVSVLTSGKRLDEKYKDHALAGEMNGQRECHLKPNLLLIYEISETELNLVRIGSHPELFG